MTAETCSDACVQLKLADVKIAQCAVHQVSRVHTEAMIDMLGLNPTKVMAIYPEHGNRTGLDTHRAIQIRRIGEAIAG